MKNEKVLTEIRAEFLHQAEELWNLNEERFRPLLEASRKEKLSINFRATIGVSQSEARLDTEISYGGERFKEKVSKIFEDPDQESLPFEGRRPGNGIPEIKPGDGLVSVGEAMGGAPIDVSRNGSDEAVERVAVANLKSAMAREDLEKSRANEATPAAYKARRAAESKSGTKKKSISKSAKAKK